MERYTIDNFAEKFHGLQPFQVIEIKAIMGDASDNIPGIKGIGTLGAIDLLKEFNDLDNIYKNLDKITGARKAKLIRSKEIAYISKSVATIVTTTEKEIDFEEMKINKPNFKHLMPFLKEKKLYNIMGRISNK
ncbi:MAG: hypothetical protein DRP42_00760 [Tenericutes bacterium]|nr:MAG: hypothetical protein DRP42_00760 [Mycoplasmatota bacterium]